MKRLRIFEIGNILYLQRIMKVPFVNEYLLNYSTLKIMLKQKKETISKYTMKYSGKIQCSHKKSRCTC